MHNNILPLNASTLNSLKLKHPEPKEAASEVLLDDIVSSIHQVKFEEISGESVRKAAIRTKGGSGPSGMDGEGWRRILTSNSFGDASENLCNAFASAIKKLCTVK
eukprot:gene712-16297_t